MHSIHINQVRTTNGKVPNRIECTLSQYTSACGSNPVRIRLEWNVVEHGLRHMTEVCTCTRDVRLWNAIDGCRLGLHGDKCFVGYLGDDDVQNQLDRIVRNKAIYQKCSYCHGLQSHVAVVSSQ